MTTPQSPDEHPSPTTPPPIPAKPDTIPEITPPKKEPPGAGWKLKLALWLVGSLVALITLSTPAPHLGELTVSLKVGRLIGGMVFFPGLVIALFSIGKIFRNSRARSIIILCCWGLQLLVAFNQMSRQLGKTVITNKEEMDSFLDQLTEQYSIETKPIEEVSFADLVGNLDRLDADADSFLEFQGATSQLQVSEVVDTSSQISGTNPAVLPEADLNYEFSNGSHERLIALIENAQTERYREIVRAYERACQARPNDANLALERVKFIERFYGSEDIYIEDTEEDYERALEYMESRFFNAPGTVLYQLRNYYGEGFQEQADQYAKEVLKWSDKDRSYYYLLRARAAEYQENWTVQHSHALKSFQADPNPEAGIMVAAGMIDAGDDAQAIQTLTHPVFKTAETWIRKQQMDLLFEAGANESGIALYRELKQSEAEVYWDQETALRIARAGETEIGRTILQEINVSDWNRKKVLNARFQFELDFGSKDEATKAYRTFRETGIGADPFFRERINLFLKHPGVLLNLEDLLSLGLLTLLFSVLMLIPLLFILPVHYWSLLREKNGKLPPWPNSPFRLWHAWIACGILLVAEILAVWWFDPTGFRSYWSDDFAEIIYEPDAMPAQQITVWVCLAMALLFILWRTGAWKVLGAGNWSLGRSFGMAVAFIFLLRILLRIYMIIVPQALEMELATMASVTNELAMQLIDRFGPLGLFAGFAIVAPILEELVFRGLLLHALCKHIPFLYANGIQAILFAAIHENYYLAPFFIAFGCVGGYLTRESRGLLPATLFHVINNTLASFGLLLLHNLR